MDKIRSVGKLGHNPVYGATIKLEKIIADFINLIPAILHGDDSFCLYTDKRKPMNGVSESMGRTGFRYLINQP